MRTRLALAALIGLAAALRSFNLDGMSLWTDEGLSFYRATKDLAFILSGRIDVGLVPTRDVQPPLYFLLLAGWFELLGATPWVGKAFSLFVSLPAIPAIWALTRRLAGRRAAWPAALFASVSPVYVWYAQEVRHYTLLVTLASVSLYALVVALDLPDARGARLWPRGRRRLRALAAALGLAALAMWVHYLAVFLIALEVAVLAAAGFLRWRSARASVGAADQTGESASRLPGPAAAVLLAVGAVALLVIPLVPFALERLRIGAERDQHFVPLQVILRDVALQFTFGVAPPTNAWWAVLVLAGLAAFGTWRAWRRSRPAAVLLAACLLVPVVGLFALTFVKPVYMGVRHILLASPAWYVILGAAVALPHAWSRVWARRAAATAAVASTVAIAGLMVPQPFVSQVNIGVLINDLFPSDPDFGTDMSFTAYHPPRAGKDDLRSMARFIESRAVPGDVLLLSDPVLAHVLQVYLPEMPISSVPMPGDVRPPSEQFAELDATASRIWFMTPGEEEAAWLDQHRVPVLRETFEGRTIPVRVEAWDREPVPGELNASTGAPPDSEPLALVGWSASPATGGSVMRMHLGLDAKNAPPFLTASVRLLDEEGHEVARVEQFQREAATDGARVAAIDVPIPAGLAPGDYDVLVSLYVPDDYIGYEGEVEYDGVEELTWPASGPLFLGQVPVGPAEAPLAPEPENPVNVSGGGWRILGLREAPSLIEAGAVDVSVWVVRAAPEGAARRLRISLVPKDGHDHAPVASAEEVELPAELAPGETRLLFVRVPPPFGDPDADAARQPGGTGTPPDRSVDPWVPVAIAASLVTDDGEPIPLERPMAYRLRRSLSGDDPTLVDLGEAEWLPRPPPVRVVPGPELPYAVEFEGLGSLVGVEPALRGPVPRSPKSETPLPEVAATLENGVLQYEVNQPAGTETELPVRLYWRAAGGATTDLVASVQLLPPPGSADGRPVAQSDAMPASDWDPVFHQTARPTSGWRAGEIVTDHRTLRLPAGLPPGDYTLAVAVYDPGHRGGRLRATVPGASAPPGGGAIQDDLVPIARVRVSAAGQVTPAP